MRAVIRTIILSLISTGLYAQVNCEKNLNDARSDYANGNLYAIPGKLTDCLSNGFSKDQKIEAYQLLALTYININQQDKAKESLIKLLKIKTDYVVIKNVDPEELYSLYNKINTKPIYYLGAGIGVNFTFPTLSDTTRRHSTETIPGGDNYKYSSAAAITGGAQFIYPVKNFLHAKASLGYDLNKYKYTQTSSVIEGDKINETTSKYSATNGGLTIAISARFMSDKKITKSYKPFLEIGFINRININSTINDYEERNFRKGEPFIATGINMNEYRRRYNYGYNLQVGSMIKINEYFGELSVGIVYYGIPETYYENQRRNQETVANASTVVEDLYNKIVLNCTFSFNIPFYNFK